MNDLAPTVFLQAHYEIDAPDFWWAINRDQLQVGSLESIRLEMCVLDDTDVEQGISRWRSQVTATRPFHLSTESRAIFTRLEDCPSMDEASTLPLLDTPMSDFKNVFSCSWVPKVFWEEMQTLHAELDHSTFKILNGLFWRLGVHCGPSTLRSEFLDLTYSTDGEHFEPLPARFDIKSVDAPPKDEGPENPALRKVFDFLPSNKEAPLHHALFREAWRCRGAEDRVSIVMATAAAECAVKQLIGSLMPGTIWLLENTQSPPVVKIVTHFFPKLPVKNAFNGVAVKPPRKVIKALGEIIECRNKIAHGSFPSMPSKEQLEAWLLAVRDLLWLTDYYNGHHWALEHISPTSVEDLQKAL